MLYLAYGSNLHPVRLRQRVPSAVLLGKAVIADRALRFHKVSVDGSAKCNMAVGPGAIHVAVFEFSTAQKRALDRVEGVGVGYRTEMLDVAGYGECYTYIAMDSHIDESLKPYSWYRELVIVGCEWLHFPRDYLDDIAAVDVIDDPDPARHARQMAIVDRARNGE